MRAAASPEMPTRILGPFPATARGGADDAWGRVCGEVGIAEHKEWGNTDIWGGKIIPPQEAPLRHRLNFSGSPEHVCETPHLPHPYGCMPWGRAGAVGDKHSPEAPRAEREPPPPCTVTPPSCPDRPPAAREKFGWGTQAGTRGLPCDPLGAGREQGLAQTRTRTPCLDSLLPPARGNAALREVAPKFPVPKQRLQNPLGAPRLGLDGAGGKGVGGLPGRRWAEPRYGAEQPPFLTNYKTLLEIAGRSATTPHLKPGSHKVPRSPQQAAGGVRQPHSLAPLRAAPRSRQDCSWC